MNDRALVGRFGFLSLTAGLLTLLACGRSLSGLGLDPLSGSPGSTPPPSNAPTATDGSMATPPELDALVESLANRCVATTNDTTTEAVLRDARAAYARGETDIPLSEQGCTRMFVQWNGKAETFAAVVSAPFGMKFNPDTGLAVRTAATVTWTTAADGKREMRGDLDADGFAELRETVVPDVSLISERVSNAGVVERRTTAKVAEGGLRLELTEEAGSDGALSVRSKYDGARVAHKCTTDPPPDNSPPPPPTTPPRPASPFPPPPHQIACAPEQLQQLDVLLQKATSGGASCMDGAGMKDIRFRLLRQMATTSFDFKCTDDPSFVAANDGGYGNVFSGRALVWINPILFTAVEAEQTATLYHELMHFFYAHDHDVEALADYSTNLAYTDRVYACEQLCFSKKANTCHLAACTQKKICDVDKSSFEQTTGRQIDSCWTGHQVGALCRKAPGQRQWCTTKSECDAACGGQECESKSISCNENCR